MAYFLNSVGSKPEAYDPILASIIEDPVVADDGYTYDRSSLRLWIDRCRACGDNICSPITRAQISIYCRSSRPERLNRTQGRENNKPQHIPNLESTIESVTTMGDLYAVLDPLHMMLSPTLDDWAPPQVVVVGQDTSGKSTLLERISQMPLFPRGCDECCGTPIRVQLRRGDEASVRLSIVDQATGCTVGGPIEHIAAEVASERVAERVQPPDDITSCTTETCRSSLWK